MRFALHLPLLAPAVAALILIASSARLPAAAPEYLAAEQPIPDSLSASASATADIGKVQDQAFEDRLRPSAVLPRLRGLVPKTGLPFIDEALFSVRPRAYYRYRDNGDDTVSEAFAVGGALGLETGWLWNSVRFGFSGYTSQKIYGPRGRDGTGLLRPEQKSYTVLGQSYVEIKVKETSTVIGRQRIDLPYINANDSRMTPSTFEAIGFRALGFKNLQIGAGHIRSIRFRDQSDFVSMSEQAGAIGADKGVTVAGFRHNFSERFHGSVVAQYGWDTFNTIYADAERLFQLNDDLSLALSTQFTDQRSVGDELIGDFETQHAGIRASLGYRSLIASTAFTWTSDKAGIMKPWGGSPAYNSVMLSDFDRAGERAIRFGLSCDFSDIGLEGIAASTSFLYGNTPDSGSAASPDQTEIDFNLDYRPQVRLLENVWLRLRFGRNWQDDYLVASDSGGFDVASGLDRYDFRVILNYSFSF